MPTVESNNCSASRNTRAVVATPASAFGSRSAASGEIVAMAAHQREQAAVLTGHRVEVSPAGEELLIDETDNMEAIGDNLGLREVFPGHRAIGGG